MDPMKRLLLEVSYESIENGKQDKIMPCNRVLLTSNDTQPVSQ